MTLYNNNKRRELIMKHYSKPDNFTKFDNPNITIYSNRCVDELNIKFKVKDSILVEIKYNGKGCAVFLSSADIVINEIKNKSLEEIKRFIEEYKKAISGEKYNDIGMAEIFDNVKKHLNRFECANMIYDAIIKVLNFK